MSLHLPPEFDSYKPQVSFNINSEQFTVKTAETREELLGAFKLRNSVFYEEWTGQSSKTGLDIDEYDPKADHLIVVQKDTQEVVGTYRLICSRFGDCFYTEKFYNITTFKNKILHNKVEVGRACTHSNLRGSKAIHHIWLGLAKYFRLTLSKYMFGCVSIVKTSPEYVASIYKTFLDLGKVDTEIAVLPLEEFAVESFDELILKSKPDKKSLLKLPRLFLWYLNIGVKIHGPPAFDPEFKSYDFFITLDFKNIGNEKLVNRYEDAVYLKNKLS